MKLVVFGQIPGAGDGGEEGRWATRMLWRNFPSSTSRSSCNAIGLRALASAASAAADAAGLTDSDRVLLLAHDQVVPAPLMLLRLGQAIDSGAATACAFDSSRTPGNVSPDYFSFRGMERFVDGLSKQPDEKCDPVSDQSVALLTSAGALRTGAWSTRAVSVAGAYVHDFSGYRGESRSEIISLIPTTVHRILDVGGGEGGFLSMLKINRGCETHLAEVSPAACRKAALRVDKVWEGDFRYLPITQTFDCICFLDCLEHVTDPGSMLVRAGTLLGRDGVVVASIPNVGHWSVVADLIEGRWDYVPAGIHCITHHRFFTRKGIDELFREAGLTIDSCQANVAAPPFWFNLGGLEGSLSVDTANLSAHSFFVVARKVV